MSAARDYALAQLDRAHLPGWTASTIKSHVPEPRDARDLALSEQLRIGTIKNLLWLTAITEHHSGRPVEKIDPLVRTIIAIALYQLRRLSRIPPSAAVDEAVDQTRRFGRSRASGFVNAVLRNATRDDDPEHLPESIRLSHPVQLLQRLAKLYDGDEQTALALCRKHNEEPPLIVRLLNGNNTAALRDGLLESVRITPHQTAGMLVVEGATRAVLSDWSRRGLAQAQDPTSAAVVDALEVKPGQTVLDRCCGVGTKTMQLSERLGADGRVFAIDPSAERCETLRATLAERGVGHVGVVQSETLCSVRDVVAKQFDRVLVDAPCGNSGVLIRRAEARYHQSAGALRSLAALQKRILTDTAPYVAPGGMLLYSTCSLWAEENERIADWFIANHDRFQCLHRQTTLPSVESDPTAHHDGGFVALFRRR